MHRLACSLLGATVLFAAGCGDPVRPVADGTIAIADGRIRFVPDSGIAVRGAEMRMEAPVSANDTRWLPGSVFWFEPGQVQEPAPEYYNRLGTLVVRYAEVLPAGADDATLHLAWWNPDNRSWTRVEGSFVDLTEGIVHAPVPARTPGRLYGVLNSRGIAVTVALGVDVPPPFPPAYRDSLRVNAWVHSDVALASVTARINDPIDTLELVNASWRGWVSTVGLPRGDYMLHATATRVDGMSMSDSVTVKVDRPVMVTVQEPLPDATIGNRFTVRATCIDEGVSAPCSDITVTAAYDGIGTTHDLQRVTSTASSAEFDMGGLKGLLTLYITGHSAPSRSGWARVRVRVQ